MGKTKQRKVGAAVAAIALVGGLMVVAAGPAAAATVVVNPGQSIQAAVDGAPAGSTILVRPGDYFETVTITKSNTRLQGSGAGSTRLFPPANAGGPCAFGPDFVQGICAVGDINFDTFEVITPVRNVSVSGFTVSGFSGSGVFILGGSGITVENTRLVDNGEYGYFALETTGQRVLNNFAAGNAEAGIYIGESPNANATVRGNTAHDNGEGIFIRSASKGTISNNEIHHNCIGIFFLNAPASPTQWSVTGNTISENNRVCTSDDPEDPALDGIGILMLGGHQITISGNTVDDNHAAALPGGGIVLGPGSSGNAVFANNAHGNTPADIVNIGGRNAIVGNRCDTSIPPGLCR
jgi:parallel beta-helix repeat protein